ncbi:MAG TPA: hypothetical protein VFA77_16610 [Candidatus Eisenbacteria bacterium]|nr:hypothetical protein [Candidatus Eisenbacteria bacterium]
MQAEENPPTIRGLIEKANQHLGRLEVKQHEQALRLAWEKGEGPAEDRVEAGVELARHLWRIKHDFDEAKELLAQAKALGVRPALPLLELAELETAEGHYASGCEAARSALTVASNSQEKRAAQTCFGQAVCDELFQTCLRGAPASIQEGTAARAREAVKLLEPVIENEPGWREPSRCQILLALLAGNGPGALRAWQSYYLLVPGETGSRPHPQSPRDFGDLGFVDGHWVNNPLQFYDPGEVLARLLPRFTNDCDVATREKVVRALAGSRLFPEAATLAIHWKLKVENATKDIIGYGRFYDRLSRRVAEEYRRHALGKSYWTHIQVPPLVDLYLGHSSFEKIIAAESKKLRRELHPEKIPLSKSNSALNTRGSALLLTPSEHSPDSPEFNLGIELRLGFGAVIRSAESPDYFSFGHSILISDKVIEQYGRKQTMRCLAVDSLVGNSYGDWLIGFTGAGVGGWASPPAEFVQVRTDWLLYVWESVSDPEIYRQRIGKRLEPLAAEDDARGKTNACGYFPGLALRLYTHGNERLLKRLRDQGLTGGELRTAFLRERDQLVFPAMILAHEGRHVFDMTEKPGGYSGAELEFRAKCSEIEFAPDPLLAVGTGSIFSANIGQRDNGHGAANARVMKGLDKWMRAHASEITNLDTSRPLLPQFDRLNDEQMRAAFRSMDPWLQTP